MLYCSKYRDDSKRIFANLMKTILLSIFLFLYPFSLTSQERNKKFTATRIAEQPIIDGKLDDKVWSDLPFATGFTQTIPYNGRKASQNTQVKIAYDNHAIYFGAMLYDTAPDSILTGLGKRDANDSDINADLFIIELNPYNNDQLLFAFKLSASGIQIDEKVGYASWDKSWDAVWYSDVSIQDHGWIAEVKIPYSALRIPSQKEQVWGMHLYRCLKRKEEWSSWTFVNEKEESTLHQAGELYGINNITPPLRLSFTPYLSSYWTHNSETGKQDFSFKGGLDLKYGINESYTLDMMLVPDFGQVQSDDAVLNLSSVETYFTEKRGFFTEGTEMFSKGDIFYSRRIGATPINFSEPYSSLDENEYISTNPTETQIVNATKISGRNAKGLGIGFLNAVTAKESATVKNRLTGEMRKETTQPITNYNVFLLDKALKNNSSICFINTNAWYTDNSRIANVTGTDFTFISKNNTFALFGKGALSQIYQDRSRFGYYYNLAFNKISGNFKFGLSQHLISDTYNPTDLGYLANNNQIENRLRFSYHIIEPRGSVLSSQNNLSLVNSWLYKPTDYAAFEIDFDSYTTFINQFGLGLFAGCTPIKKYDFYEPRVKGWKVEEPTAWYVGVNGQTDLKKSFALFFEYFYWGATEYNKQLNMLTVKPSFRLSENLTMSYTFWLESNENAIGYVKHIDTTDTIYFGRRDMKTISNAFETDFIFSKTSSISLRARHYWSRVNYKQFYELNRNGTLNSHINFDGADNINFNALNIDLVYSWQFAPGSQLSIVWKNDIYNNGTITKKSFFDNLSDTWDSPQQNSLSVKVLYYLDYLHFKRKKYVI